MLLTMLLTSSTVHPGERHRPSLIGVLHHTRLDPRGHSRTPPTHPDHLSDATTPGMATPIRACLRATPGDSGAARRRSAKLGERQVRARRHRCWQSDS
jgi:hypothetical protein